MKNEKVPGKAVDLAKCEAEQKNKSPSEVSEQRTELINHWLNSLMIWKR